MNKKIISILFPIISMSEEIVVPNDKYKIGGNEDITYIYSKEYENRLPSISSYQHNVMEQYQNDFGYRLDDTLYVGLASDKNQIANGFSSQIPFNFQLLFDGGVSDIDYFCFTSWLKTLIIHETAHNFQINVKDNSISKVAHKIVRNVPFSSLVFFPIFPIPNLVESSFIVEGNAVLNESRFNNGGRLYSGYALAELVSFAKADKIKPEILYNDTLEFPYREKAYIVGGFFQLFLAKKYGVQRVNKYFKIHSKQLLPFFTNIAFEETFGKSFETLLEEFAEETKSKYRGFKRTEGRLIAESLIFEPINGQDEELYTMISDNESFPKMLIFNKKNRELRFKVGTWKRGEPFKIDGVYYTQTSSKISPTKIVMGLFDTDLYLKEGSEAKILQGYRPNGDEVYFDLYESLEMPQIYINGNFYDISHSSVHIDKKGNLYYFKQKNEIRTLYKNKKPIFNYRGHYGFVTDVDEDEKIYFIAKSNNGTSAYSYNPKEKNIKRVTIGDDIIDFRLINDKEALVTTIDDEGYRYQIVNKISIDSKIGDTDYWLEEKNSLVTKNSQPFKYSDKPLNSQEYIPITELRYSSLEQKMDFSTDDNMVLNLKANFDDPLLQNRLSFTLFREEDKTITGLQYYNGEYQLGFGIAGYGVFYDGGDKPNDEEEYGYSVKLDYPFLSTGYWKASTTISYDRQYDSYRKPATISLNITNSRQFGKSKYPNHLDSIDLFSIRDRDSFYFGGSYRWMHQLGWQSYIGLGASYLKADEMDERFDRGIEIDDSWGDIAEDYASVVMPTLDETLYAKKLSVAEMSLYKVFNTHLYFFSSPFSLQRETFYLKHKFFDIELRNENRQYNEFTVGIENDILFMHKVPIPIKVEWLYNEDSRDKAILRIMVEGGF